MGSTRRTRVARVLIVIGLVVALAGVGFYWWASTPMGPDENAVEALQTDEMVDVTLTDDLAVFAPVGDEPKVGVILYPGGRVDFRSYAPLARDIAEFGFLVAIPRMPLNLAVFEPDAAQQIIDDNPDIFAWAVGGHSLGGSMAASFVDLHPDEVRALVLLASYPPSSADLSARDDLLVLSTYGTLDGVLSASGLENSAELLPPDTTFTPILGGNHAQFGSYGPQFRDNEAQIPAEEQQLQAAESIALLLRPIRLQTLTP